MKLNGEYMHTHVTVVTFVTVAPVVTHRTPAIAYCERRFIGILRDARTRTISRRAVHRATCIARNRRHQVAPPVANPCGTSTGQPETPIRSSAHCNIVPVRSACKSLRLLSIALSVGRIVGHCGSSRRPIAHSRERHEHMSNRRVTHVARAAEHCRAR